MGTVYQNFSDFVTQSFYFLNSSLKMIFNFLSCFPKLYDTLVSYINKMPSFIIPLMMCALSVSICKAVLFLARRG